MGIVSSEPIVLIGPGSEWFWIMAQFVVVAITLVGIYYQFRLQRSANAFDQLNRIQTEWNSEFYMRSRLSAARAVKAGKAPPLDTVIAIGNYWEGVATLVRRGHVDARVVYDALGNSTRYWWALLEDTTRRNREESEASDVLIHFEWLADVFAGFAERDGARTDFTYAALVADIDAQIEAWEHRLRLLEEMRMVPERVSAAPAAAETVAETEAPVAS